MVNVWKEKVLPKIKGVFGPGSAKKAAAAEATKYFDESKETIDKELEEKKADLEPKVIEIYEASSTSIKTLVKTPTESGVKKNSSGVTKLFADLAKIEFPGATAVSESITKFGPGLCSGSVVYIIQKVTTFIPVEETPAPAEPEAADQTPAEAPRELTVEETIKEGEIKVEETPAPAPPADETAKPAEPVAEPAKPTEPVAEPAKPAEPVAEPSKPAEPAVAEPPKPVDEPAKP